MPGSSHVKMLGLEQADDRKIWQYAQDNGFALVTKDVDFYEMSLLQGAPPKIIWLRCGNSTNKFVEDLLLGHLSTIQAFPSHENENVCLELE